MDYYIAIRKNRAIQFAATWRDLLSEVTQRAKTTQSDPYMLDIEKYSDEIVNYQI